MNAPTRPVRPRDAASLIILRGKGEATEVLLGKRAAKHKFMPNFYVFPGGRVDAADRMAPAVSELRPDVAKRLNRRWPTRMARALAVAAMRETYEECGLVFGQVDDGRLKPDLEVIDYFGRAITPPHSPIRFHARFFLAHDEDASGHLADSHELLDLQWLTLDKALELPLVDVTEYMLEQLSRRIAGHPMPGAPLFVYRRGKAAARYEPH